ncbi:unnamed protein product [Cyclocybe aegerita]|uniref:Integrase catalytic domain-containing protein n=1 Tax=Cyclocybe aegerita TaxID=1973307 RepID=A0A8S0XYW9_CYCAE|nr:unnamed protein product [Cyclocybe aegerita]
MPSLQSQMTSYASDGNLYGDDSLLNGGDHFSEVAEDAHEYNDSEWEMDDIPESPSKDYMAVHIHFKTFEEIPPKTFCAANKQSFSATGKGEMVIDIPDGVESSQLWLMEVLYSPEVGYTLGSIGHLGEKGFSVTFGSRKCVIRGPEGKIAQKLINYKFVTGVHLEHMMSGKPFFCESCVYAKATRKLILKEREGKCAAEFSGEVHSDLWGPAPVKSKGGKCYYITFTDDKTHLTNLFLLCKKDEAFAAYRDYEAWCDTQLNTCVKVLHSDRGGEYLGKEFILHLKSKGTEWKLTMHDTPQHNGVAKRCNCTIAECIWALLHLSGLLKSLWGEAA